MTGCAEWYREGRRKNKRTVDREEGESERCRRPATTLQQTVHIKVKNTMLELCLVLLSFRVDLRYMFVSDLGMLRFFILSVSGAFLPGVQCCPRLPYVHMLTCCEINHG